MEEEEEYVVERRGEEDEDKKGERTRSGEQEEEEEKEEEAERERAAKQMCLSFNATQLLLQLLHVTCDDVRKIMQSIYIYIYLYCFFGKSCMHVKFCYDEMDTWTNGMLISGNVLFY